MKTLLLLRHAKSSWDDPATVDHERPLNKRGKRDAPRVGSYLAAMSLIPDLVLSSTARRARKTAEKSAKAGGFKDRIRLCRELYLAEASTIVAVLQEIDDAIARLLVVGHNPGLEDMLRALTGQQLRLPTATLVHLTLQVDTWRDVRLETTATLVSLWAAKSADD